jgi:hypothetical protein
VFSSALNDQSTFYDPVVRPLATIRLHYRELSMIYPEPPAFDAPSHRRINRLPTIESQLVAWINAVDRGEAARAITLKRAGFSVYVRRSHRRIEGRDVITLDIANVAIPLRWQRRGWFTAFRQLAERLNPWDAVIYEAVINPDLNRSFQRAGLNTFGEDSYYVLCHRHGRQNTV